MTEAVLEEIKVSVKSGKPCEKIVSVEVPQHMIQSEYDEFYRAVVPRAKVPGFRTGKIPRNILEMHYQGEAKEHVLQHLISNSFRKAIQESTLEPLIMPSIQDVQFDHRKLAYKAHVEIRPKVKLSKVKGLSAKKEKVELTEADVEKELSRIRESLAKHKPVEGRPAQMGDIVVADYTCESGGKEIDKRDEDWIELTEDSFLKELCQGLVGVNAGEDKEIEITFPKDFGRKELAGQKALFRLKVKEIKTKELPALDDEMAKDAGEFQTLEELKKKTREDLLKIREHEAERKFEDGLLQEFVKKNKIDIPEGLVAKRQETLFDQARQRFMGQGASEKALEEKKEELLKSFREEAVRQVHLAFLLDEVSIQEKIQVGDVDLKLKYEQMGAQYRQPAEKIEEYYTNQQEAVESLKEQIRNEKAIAFIKQHAKSK